MSVVSAGLMLLFAWRILSRPAASNSGSDAGSVLGNYVSAVAFNCLNPLLLVLLVGAIGVVIGPERPLGPAVSMVLLGVFAGSVGWWIVLSAVTSTLRGRLSLGRHAGHQSRGSGRNGRVCGTFAGPSSRGLTQDGGVTRALS